MRRAGDRVRIVAQLIDAATDRHLWAETYDRAADRHLRDPDRRRAADRGRARGGAVAGRADPDPPGAHGRRPGLPALPPGTALLHPVHRGEHPEGHRVLRARRSRRIPGMPWPTSASPWPMPSWRRERAAARFGRTRRTTRAWRPSSAALELDPDLGEAHAVLALLRMVHDFDWAGAEAEFKLALELSPGAADIYDHYGWLCAALERYDEALALVRRAQELDPLTHRADVATTLLRAGRYEEALQAALRARRVRSRVRAGALHAGVGLPEVGDAGPGSGRAGAGGRGSPPGTRCTWRSSARPTG